MTLQPSWILCVRVCVCACRRSSRLTLKRFAENKPHSQAARFLCSLSVVCYIIKAPYFGSWPHLSPQVQNQYGELLRSGRLNVLCGAENFSKEWSAVGHFEIQYTK
jgi:hypothetical protein